VFVGCYLWYLNFLGNCENFMILIKERFRYLEWFKFQYTFFRRTLFILDFERIEWIDECIFLWMKEIFTVRKKCFNFCIKSGYSLLDLWFIFWEVINKISGIQKYRKFIVKFVFVWIPNLDKIQQNHENYFDLDLKM